MQESNELNAAERELEAVLKTMRPAAARIDPVLAAFSAGQRSARRQVRLWQSAAAFFLMMGVGGWLLNVSTTQVVDRPFDPTIAIVAPSAAMQTVPDQSVARLRQAMRDHGINGLPEVHVPAVQVIQAQEML